MKKLQSILSYIFITSLLFAQTQPQETVTDSEDEVLVLPEVVTYINNSFAAVEQRQIFTQEDIQEKNITDLPSLLESAGVQILSYGPYGLEQKPSIRGFTDETVRVIIDGICVNNSQYGTFDFSSLNTNDIEKLEIVRGGFTESVIDEDAVAGAIYITTKKQDFGTHFYSDSLVKTFFNANSFFDTFSQKAGYNTDFGNNFLKLAGQITWANNQYLYKNYADKLKQRENAQVLDGNFNGNFNHYFKDGSVLSASDIFYGGNKNTPGSDSAKNCGKLQDFDNNLSFQLINPEIADSFRLENNLSWLSNTRFYSDNGSSDRLSKHFVNSLRYNITQDVYYFRQYKQSFGLSFDYTHLNSTDDGLHNQFSGAFKSTSKFFVPFGQSGFNEFKVSVPLAVKFSGQNFAFTPKLGAGFSFKYFDFFLDGYRMTQFPNMDDLFWDDGTYKGNPDLKPETGWGGEVTLNFKNIWLPFSVCVFSNYYENKIQWAGLSPQNVASAFYAGANLKIEKSFWQNHILVSSYSEYLYNRLLDKTNKVTYGKRIMWTPDFVSNLSVVLNLPDVGAKNPVEPSFVVEANYVGKRYITNVNTSFMEPYLLLNFSAQVKCGVPAKNDYLNIIPYLRADNLLNWDYEAVPDYPMPGINLSVGVKIQK